MYPGRKLTKPEGVDWVEVRCQRGIVCGAITMINVQKDRSQQRHPSANSSHCTHLLSNLYSAIILADSRPQCYVFSSSPRHTLHTVPSHLSRVSTIMASLHRSQGDNLLPMLDAVIWVLSAAKDTCGPPPAQVALDSTNTLLTIIRVHFPLLYDDEVLTHAYLGLNTKRYRLHRARALLRQNMSSLFQGVG